MSEYHHLDYQALAVAAVEASELTPGQREHLATCELCQGRLAELEAGLEGLGGLARRMAPDPPRRFHLPPEAKTFSRAWLWRGSLAGGLAATALVLVSLWLGAPGRQSPATGPAVPQVPALATVSDELDQGFVSIMEVNEEDPFSPFQRFVLGGEDSSWDEQFMDFVSPFDLEDYSRLEKGRARC